LLKEAKKHDAHFVLPLLIWWWGQD